MFLRTVKIHQDKNTNRWLKAIEMKRANHNREFYFLPEVIEEGKADTLFTALTRNNEKINALDIANSISISETDIFGQFLLLATLFNKRDIFTMLSVLFKGRMMEIF